MTDVASTPPALRWVAIFLAVCAVLGLFLGFRDQIRKNPPGWYTGAEQIATPLATPPDGAREAVPFDPNAPTAATAPRPSAPAGKTPAEALEEPAAATPADAAAAPDTPAAKPIAPPVVTPGPAPKPKSAATAPKAAPSGDPVGDILEGEVLLRGLALAGKRGGDVLGRHDALVLGRRGGVPEGICHVLLLLL